MPSNKFCHFCGRSDSINAIPETTKYVCSLCWEIIVYIVAQFFVVLTDQAVPTNDAIILEFLKKKLEEKVEHSD